MLIGLPKHRPRGAIRFLDCETAARKTGTKAMNISVLMKRLLLLAACVALFSLTACGGSGETTAQVRPVLDPTYRGIA